MFILQNKLANVANDEAALDEKIERRKKEFEQMQKRFVKLQVSVDYGDLTLLNCVACFLVGHRTGHSRPSSRRSPKAMVGFLTTHETRL